MVAQTITTNPSEIKSPRKQYWGGGSKKVGGIHIGGVRSVRRCHTLILFERVQQRHVDAAAG